MDLNFECMKTKYFALFVLTILLFPACKGNMNEPQNENDNLTVISFPSPQIANGGENNVPPRGIAGNVKLNQDTITFYWSAGDLITFDFYEGKTLIETKTYTVKSSDISKTYPYDTKVAISIPTNATSYKASSGASDFPNKQIFKSNFVWNNMMRFEAEVTDVTLPQVVLKPIWSVLIVKPTYYFNTTYSISGSININSINVTQTGDETTNIVYGSNNLDPAFGVTFSETVPPSPVFVIVVKPETSSIKFVCTYGTSTATEDGTSNEYKSTHTNLEINSNGTIPFVAGCAFAIDPTLTILNQTFDWVEK